MLGLVAAQGCGSPPLEPREPTPGVFHLRVMTYNIQVDDNGSPSTLAAIGKPDADIVCIQEADWDWPDAIREAYGDEYPHQIFHDADHPAGAMAVLSRYPLTDLGVRLDENGWHPALRLQVETPRGVIDILHVHLRPVFSGEANAISSYLQVDDDHLMQIGDFHVQATDPVQLVMGDFNEESNGTAVRLLEQQGFEDVLPLFHPGQQTWRHASLAGQFDAAIDHIMFGEQLVPLNAFVMREGESDHLPVIADFEWPE